MQLRAVALVFAVSSLVACTERDQPAPAPASQSAPATAATNKKLDPKSLQVLKLNPAIKALKPTVPGAAAEAASAALQVAASAAPSASAPAAPAPSASALAAASGAAQKAPSGK